MEYENRPDVYGADPSTRADFYLEDESIFDGRDEDDIGD